MANPATLLHHRIQVRIIGLDGGDTADQLATGIVFPTRQRIGIDDVEMSATGDDAPFVAIKCKKVGMRCVVGVGGRKPRSK